MGRHKQFTLLITILLVVLPMTKSAGVDVKVNKLPDFSSPVMTDKPEAAVVKRFLELRPEIRLTRAAGLQIEGQSSTMDMVPLMQIAGDIAPDVLYLNFRLSDTYIQKGFLKPLDEYISKMSREELNRRVPSAVRDVCYRRGPDGKKHWYALPISRTVRVLAYRRDLFEQVGLDPDRPPRTWDELYTYCRRLADPARSKYGIVFLSGANSSYDFANLVWSCGGEVIAQNARGEWEPRFNTPAVVDALYFYLKLTQARVKGRDGRMYRGVASRTAGYGLFEPGDPYAMCLRPLQERMNFENIQRYRQIGYAPVPYSTRGGKSASEVNCAMLGLFSGVKDRRKAQAAFDYIRFIDSDEANRVRTKVYVQRGYGRFVYPRLLEKYGYSDYGRQSRVEWASVYDEAMRNAKPEPYGKNCAMIYRELSRPIEETVNDKSILSALDRGDEQEVKARLKVILDRAQAETAKRMFGILPPDVTRLRQILTVVVLALTLGGFVFAATYIVRSFRSSAPAQSPGQKKAFVAYLLLFPAIATVILWQYYPLIRGTIIAFEDYNIVGHSSLVGISNFSDVLFDRNFWHSVYITALYTATFMVFGFISPIFLALLLAEVPRGKMFFRTVYYLPTVLSTLVVMFLWKSFYRPAGLLNAALGYIGVDISVGWLESPYLAMAAVLLPVIWAGMGPGSLIYLAALKTIPEEFYEAAEVDGAGMIRKVFSITLPGLKMLILINAVGAFIGAFMTSESILAMTGGGPYTPYGSTEVVGLHIFYTAFMYLKFGVANAMAWVLGFMLIGFTMFQLKNLSRVEFKGGQS